jgi:hypothetical protein
MAGAACRWHMRAAGRAAWGASSSRFDPRRRHRIVRLSRLKCCTADQAAAAANRRPRVLLTGEAFERAQTAGRWSRIWPVPRWPPKKANFQRQQRGAAARRAPKASHALLVTYKDGTRATILKVGSVGSLASLAVWRRSNRRDRALAAVGQPCTCSRLSHAIAHFFKTGNRLILSNAHCSSAASSTPRCTAQRAASPRRHLLRLSAAGLFFP